MNSFHFIREKIKTQREEELFQVPQLVLAVVRSRSHSLASAKVGQSVKWQYIEALLVVCHQWWVKGFIARIRISES